MVLPHEEGKFIDGVLWCSVFTQGVNLHLVDVNNTATTPESFNF